MLTEGLKDGIVPPSHHELGPSTRKFDVFLIAETEVLCYPFFQYGVVIVHG